MLKNILNKIFLQTKCIEYKHNNWYIKNHETHNIYIKPSDHKYAEYKVYIYDGEKWVSNFYTNNLWSI